MHLDVRGRVSLVKASRHLLTAEVLHPLLQEYTAKLGALQVKGDDYEIAAAQIGVEVYSAMSAAVGA